MPAVKVLTGKGWAVQLVHNSTEPAGDVHGFILVKDEAGTVFVDCQDFQHNRQDFYMPNWGKQLADLLSSVPNAKNAETKDAAPCDGGSDASTTESSHNVSRASSPEYGCTNFCSILVRGRDENNP